MRIFLGSFIFTALVFSASPTYGQARAINVHGQCLAQPGDQVVFDDFLTLMEELQEVAKVEKTKKTPYETDADFALRIKKFPQPTRVVAGYLDANYVPEEQAFYFPKLSNPQLGGHYSVTLNEGNKNVRGEAVASNGWGDTWNVKLTRQLKLVIYDRPAERFNNRNPGGLSKNSEPEMYFGTEKARPVSREMEDRCGPYGCFLDSISWDVTGRVRQPNISLDDRQFMFQHDAIRTNSAGVNRKGQWPSIKLEMPKAVAESNHGKLRFGYVYTPKGAQAFVHKSGGKNQLTQYVLEGDIHCALIVDKDKNVLKVIPTAYGKTAYGPVLDRNPFPNTTLSALTDIDQAPQISAKMNDLANKGFEVLSISNIRKMDIVERPIIGGLELESDFTVSLKNQQNSPVQYLKYALVMYPNGKPDKAHIFESYKRLNNADGDEIEIKIGDFRYADLPSEFLSTNIKDYTFKVVAIEISRGRNNSQVFFEDDQKILEALKTQ